MAKKKQAGPVTCNKQGCWRTGFSFLSWKSRQVSLNSFFQDRILDRNAEKIFTFMRFCLKYGSEKSLSRETCLELSLKLRNKNLSTSLSFLKTSCRGQKTGKAEKWSFTKFSVSASEVEKLLSSSLLILAAWDSWWGVRRKQWLWRVFCST